MRCHVCALQHLCKSAEGTYYAFNQLKCRLRALSEIIGKAVVGIVGVIWVSRLAVHA